MLETLPEVKSRYDEFRRMIYAETAQVFSRFGITLKPISADAARTADCWSARESNPDKQPSWSWQSMYDNYNHDRALKRFDVAVYCGNTLCALCYGIPTKRKLILKLHLLQRMPSPNPLSGNTLNIVLYAAKVYAKILGSLELWICEPMNERLVTLYKKDYGFTEVREPKTGVVTHLTKKT
jgi:hypothetical protein